MTLRPFAHLVLILVVACSAAPATEHVTTMAQQGKAYTIDHSMWDALLRKYVDSAGNVDYQGFKNDPGFGRYLKVLERFPPTANMTQNDRMAFWINAYNAYTIKLIIDNWPVRSIKDINSPWEQKIAKIGNETMDLDHIEHGILREEFKDPRIHFAINCASFSCPILLDRAYQASTLDAQLEAAASRFINDPARNALGASELRLSRIFDWFKGDFTRNGDLVAFVSRYSEVQIGAEAKISYMEYDWSLNRK